VTITKFLLVFTCKHRMQMWY